MATATRTLKAPDGRDLEVLTAGPEQAPAVVVHHGTPGVREDYPPFVDAVVARGLRWVAVTRPGYAGSTRRPGRTVADDTDDVETVLDALGVQRYVAMGGSGGGPHALAGGARLAPRCAGVVTIAGVGPFDASAANGLDFLAGMAPENHEEFGAALAGEPDLRAWLGPFASELAAITGEQVGAALGGLVDTPDLAVLTGEFADYGATSLRAAVSTGVDGWIDDDLAFTRPWGFAMTDVAVPVAVWQGDHDRMVPFAHGEWLAARLPDVRAHLLPGEGHLSLAAHHIDAMVAEAVEFLG